MGKKVRLLLTTVIGSIVVISIVTVMALMRKSQLDASSQVLAISVTESVFIDEDFDVLVANSHDSLIEQYTAENLIRTMSSIIKRLGPLELMSSISGSAEIPLLPFVSEPPRASYSIALSFNGNSADAIIEMVYANNEWLMTVYRIDSQLLYD